MYKTETYFDLNRSEFRSIFDNVKYVWDILPEIKNRIKEIMMNLDERYSEISPGVWVGEGSVIADTATIIAPCVIGCNSEIRHAAFIRGNVIVGNGVVIGNSCEVKNSFIFDKAQVPHFNYVGDSILGYKAHIGAGVILSNVKSIKGSVNVKNGEEVIDTGLRKFSAILGDNSEVGCNSVLNPGTLIGKESVVYPLSSVRGVIPEGHIYKDSMRIVKKIKNSE